MLGCEKASVPDGGPTPRVPALLCSWQSAAWWCRWAACWTSACRWTATPSSQRPCCCEPPSTARRTWSCSRCRREPAPPSSRWVPGRQQQKAEGIGTRHTLAMARSPPSLPPAVPCLPASSLVVRQDKNETFLHLLLKRPASELGSLPWQLLLPKLTLLSAVDKDGRSPLHYVGAYG